MNNIARVTAIEADVRLSVSYLQGAPPDRSRRQVRGLVMNLTDKLLDDLEEMANSLDSDEELKLRLVFELLPPADEGNPKG